MNLEYWRDYVDEIEATPVDALLGKTSTPVRTALDHALAKKELTPDEGLLLYTSEGDDRFMVSRHLHHQAGGDGKDQRAMSDAFAERAAFGVILIHVQFDEIARETREIDDIGFGDGAAARGADLIDRIVFEVHTQYVIIALLCAIKLR